MRPEHLELIKNTLQNDSFCLLEKFSAIADLPSWSNLINSLDDAAHKKADFHINDPFIETQINHVIRRGAGYFYGFFDNKDVHVQPLIAPLIQTLKDNDLDFFGSSIFLNLFTDDDYAKPHKDEWSNNLYIQCEGSTDWRFYDDPNSEECLDTITLNPGDAVVFTGNVYHAVSAMTPRASIVLRMAREAQ